MSLAPIHDPAKGPLRLVALMSGSGTNLRKILARQAELARRGETPFRVVAIFSDRADSQAANIGAEYDLPVVIRDLPGWLRNNKVERRDLVRREQFDRENLAILRQFNAPMAIYAGYMAIASPTLINAYLGVNVHPADLRVKNENGGRRYTGAHAVRDAIAAGEPSIRSTTHLVTQEVDMGPLLMVSPPVKVELPENADLLKNETLFEISDHNQEKLKEGGDWIIFPRTIEALARGFYQRDEKGHIFYKGRPVPEGIEYSPAEFE